MNDERVMEDLLTIKKNLENKQEAEKFYFFEIGGSGQRYNDKHVKLMREIFNLGGITHDQFRGGVNKYDDSALLLAALHDDYRFMIFLLDNGANPLEIRYNDKDTFDYCDEVGKRIMLSYFTKESFDEWKNSRCDGKLTKPDSRTLKNLTMKEYYDHNVRRL